MENKEKTKTIYRPRIELRKRRRILGMSQTDLAKRLRVQPCTVSFWESGARSPADSMVPTLARELGMEPAAVLPLIDG